MKPPPGIAIPVELAYALFALAVIAMGVTLYVHIRRAHIPWLPLPGYYFGTRYVAPPDVGPELIVAALQAAETALIEHTPWTAQNMALVCFHVHIYVRNDTSWVTPWNGQRVAGLQEGYRLIVGRDLAAVCHEMAHLAEDVLDRAVDTEHKGWVVKGIEAAMNQYAQWLKRQYAVEPGFVALGVSPLVRAAIATRADTMCRHKEKA